MENTRNTNRLHTTIINASYLHDLSLYNEAPCTEIQLSEFEVLAIERLQLLKTIEDASLEGHEVFSDQWRECVKNNLTNIDLKKYVRLMSGLCEQTDLDIEARRADHLSHYILRLVFCRKEDLQRWFIAREMDWFRTKFIAQSSIAKMKFLELNKISYISLECGQKEAIKPDLIACSPHNTEAIVNTVDYYKVPFTEVLSLVRDRKVFVKGGYAYITLEDIVFCIQTKFQRDLQQILDEMNEKLPAVDDDRLEGVLEKLLAAYMENQYSFGTYKGHINPTDLDEYSEIHFPLCMRHLHEMLRANHHLKNYGRLIYGLFLKAIGLHYDDCLKFWRNEFTQIMDDEKFNKQYLYHIKHQFGMVGRKVDYDPFNCAAIIMNDWSHNEGHGCPFKHFDLSILKARLKQYGALDQDIGKITDLVNNGQYQVACTRYFELKHSQSLAMTISHPNQYFEESRKLIITDDSSSEKG